MGYTLYQIVFLFFVYAFLGWCAEVVFHAVTFGRFINRGFLNGPVCPIYGIGIVVVVLLLEPWKEMALLLFLTSMLLTSLLEFLTGFIMEKIFHARWWDYTGEPFHLGPYICLKFSLMWGLACVLVVRILHPFILTVLTLLPITAGKILLLIFSFVIAADLVATIASINTILQKLKVLHGIANEIHAISDRIGEKLSDSALEALEKEKLSKEVLGAYRNQLDQRLEVLGAYTDQLKERLGDQWEQSITHLFEMRSIFYKKLSENRFGHRRILKAFPQLHSKKYQHILNELRRVTFKRK